MSLLGSSGKGKSRRSLRKAFRFKLKRTTVLSIGAVIFLSLASLVVLSFLRQGILLIKINEYLWAYFGGGTFFIPFILGIAGLMLTRVRISVNEPHVLVGSTIFLFALIGVTSQGIIGSEISLMMAEMITPFGSFFVMSGILVISLIILFNTSLDQVVLFVLKILDQLKNYLVSTKKPLAPRISLEDKVLPRLAEKPQEINRNQPPVPAPKKEILPNLAEVPPGQNNLIWQYPPSTLLSDSSGGKADRGDVNKNADVIEKTLDSFGIGARVAEVNKGPAVTQYAIEVASGTKLSKITSLSNDMALALAAPHGLIRIEAPIPGRNLVGIELPNRSPEFVTFRKMLESDKMRNAKGKLTVALGLDVSGQPVVTDLARMPHVLIAGSTGSGKTVCLNTFVTSLLFRASPNEVRLILVDPKRVELIQYNGVPHLLTPAIVEPEQVVSSLKWAIKEMDNRYKKFAEAGVRNIDGFNELAGFSAMPFIVIVIDELADIMLFSPVEVEDAICRIAQMARATGIHLVIATQRPSVDVLTGLIKANIPCRISFAVSSMIDSRVIIDQPGAEKLLGRGDMLFVPPDQAKPTRIQGAYVSDGDIKSLINFLKNQAAPAYTEEVVTMPVGTTRRGGGGFGADTNEKDVLFDDAVKVICQYDKASASLLQRRLSVGYARAAKLLDQMEAAGLVGPSDGSKPREVLYRNPEDVPPSQSTG